MSIPLVSISCITYNHARFIRRCLDGFMMQQCDFDFEVLIHDDASTDGTQEIIREYQEKYPEIIKPVFQSENQWSKGVSISATYNWPRAEGKYIAACEGDDYWTDPFKLQKQVDFLEGNEEYAGCFHLTPMLIDDSFGERIFGSNAPDVVNAEESISLWSLFHTSSFVFKRSALYYPKELQNIFSGDMALFSIIAKSGLLKKIPEKMSVYRKHEGGITNRNDNTHEFFIQRIKLMKFLDKVHDYKYHKKVERNIGELNKYRRQAFGAIGIREKIIYRLKAKAKKIKYIFAG